MSPEKEMSAKIRSIGFVMTCLMVCYHCTGFSNDYAVGGWDAKINTLIETIFRQNGYIVMSHFFAVSGYLLFKNFKPKDYPAKIKRRFFSLLIPYLTWQCITCCIDIFYKQYAFSLSDFLRKTFCLVHSPPNGALWYVYAVFLLAVFSPILLIFFRNRYVGWLIILLLVIAARCIPFITNPFLVAFFNHGYIGNIRTYITPYLVGCYCGKFSDENTDKESLTCILSAILISFLLNELLPNFFSSTAMGLLPLAGLYALPMTPLLRNRRIYGLSFLIYALHAPIIKYSYRLLRVRFLLKIPMPVSLRTILIRALTLALCIGLAFIIDTVLKRYSPKLLRALTGGRSSNNAS